MDLRSAAFDWKSLATWGETVGTYVPSLRDRLCDKTAASPESFKFVHDWSGFEKLYQSIGGDFEALLDAFVLSFSMHFGCIRMYHCCRCLTPTSYYENWMQVLNRESANRYR